MSADGPYEPTVGMVATSWGFSDSDGWSGGLAQDAEGKSWTWRVAYGKYREEGRAVDAYQARARLDAAVRRICRHADVPCLEIVWPEQA